MTESGEALERERKRVQLQPRRQCKPDQITPSNPNPNPQPVLSASQRGLEGAWLALSACRSWTFLKLLGVARAIITECACISGASKKRCCFPCDTPYCQLWPPSCCTRDKAMTAFKGIWTQQFWRCVGAEFFATLFFVLLSLGSTINWGAVEEEPRPPDLVLISLCFGLSIATMVQCFGHISGSHINPAVTTAMVVTRKLSLAKAVFYLLAQCVGAIVGAAILFGVTPASVRGGMGVTKVNTSISVGNALVVELFITFQLVFTVFATCDHRRIDLKGSSALAIGLSVCVGHLFAIPYTGASMNPARSFGPAMITWCWDNHWVYWVGPSLGGALAAALYEYLFCPDPELKKRYSDAFMKTPFAATKHRQDSVTAQEPLFTVMDVERAERKEREREVSGEVLSSV